MSTAQTLTGWLPIETAQWALGQFCREKCTDETRNKATRRAIVRAVANQEWSMSRCTKNETQV